MSSKARRPPPVTRVDKTRDEQVATGGDFDQEQGRQLGIDTAVFVVLDMDAAGRNAQVWIGYGGSV